MGMDTELFLSATLFAIIAFILKSLKNSSRRKPYNPKPYESYQPQPSLSQNDLFTISKPYDLRNSLLTKREMDFYIILKAILAHSSFTIAIKPRIADFIGVAFNQKSNPSAFWHYFNQISSKHVDFLICNDFMKPVLAIELDDNSHDRSDRVERDSFVNGLYGIVGLKVFRINEYSFNSLQTLLSEFLLLKTL